MYFSTSGPDLLSLTVSISAFQTGPSVTVTCAEGKWNKQVACEPVDCGVPDHHHVYAASFSCPEGTTFGSKCSFQCRHPAQLKGTVSLCLSSAPLCQWETSRLIPGPPSGSQTPSDIYVLDFFLPIGFNT